MQSIPKDTRTVIALCCIGSLSIETEIDKRKLIFFGQLCNLPPDYRVKEVFVYRLMHYLNNPSSVTGFFPDLQRILGKYQLDFHMFEFIKDGIFPSKHSWKRLVIRSITHVETQKLHHSIVNETFLNGFGKIHNTLNPCVIWEFSKKCREHTNRCITVMNLMSRLFGFNYNTKCILCGSETESITIHLIMYCQNNYSVQLKLWNSLYFNLGQDNYEAFINLSPKEQCIEMFAALPSFSLSDAERKQCFTLIIVQLHKLGSSLRLPYNRGSKVIR